MTAWDLAPLAAPACAPGAGALAGLVSGLLVARAGLVPFCCHLGHDGCCPFTGVCYFRGQVGQHAVPLVELLGNATLLGIPVTFIRLVSFYALMWYFCTAPRLEGPSTQLGPMKNLPRLAGIADKIKILCYVLSGFAQRWPVCFWPDAFCPSTVGYCG